MYKRQLYNASDVFARPDGTIFEQQQRIEKSITDLKTRADTLTQQIERRRVALVRQFTEMERAISRIQSQGSAITGYINALQSSNQ